MHKLQKLVATGLLLFLLSVSAMAGETHSPPGETASPPIAAAGETNTPPGETHTPPGETNSPPAATSAGLFADLLSWLLG